MRSLFLAASAFTAGLLLGQTNSKKYLAEKRPSVALEGYIAYHFRCWLCHGQTGFGLKPCLDERLMKMDCSRCGVENVITVRASQKIA